MVEADRIILKRADISLEEWGSVGEFSMRFARVGAMLGLSPLWPSGEGRDCGAGPTSAHAPSL
jgi:hypothetical protein